MSIKARILNKLYQQGKVSAAGIAKALSDGTITQEEHDTIVNA